MKKSLAILLCGAMFFGSSVVTFAEEEAATEEAATEEAATEEAAEEEAAADEAAKVEVPEAAKASYEKLLEAEKTLMTTDNHPMMDAPLAFDVPEVDGDAAYCEDNYEEIERVSTAWEKEKAMKLRQQNLYSRLLKLTAWNFLHPVLHQ